MQICKLQTCLYLEDLPVSSAIRFLLDSFYIALRPSGQLHSCTRWGKLQAARANPQQRASRAMGSTTGEEVAASRAALNTATPRQFNLLRSWSNPISPEQFEFVTVPKCSKVHNSNELLHGQTQRRHSTLTSGAPFCSPAPTPFSPTHTHQF